LLENIKNVIKILNTSGWKQGVRIALFKLHNMTHTHRYAA